MGLCCASWDTAHPTLTGSFSCNLIVCVCLGLVLAPDPNAEHRSSLGSSGCAVPRGRLRGGQEVLGLCLQQWQGSDKSCSALAGRAAHQQCLCTYCVRASQKAQIQTEIPLTVVALAEPVRAWQPLGAAAAVSTPGECLS